MAVTGIGNSYNNVHESTYVLQKNEMSRKNETNRRQSDSINISEDGRNALKERASAIKSFGQSEEVKKLSSMSAFGIMNEFEKIMSKQEEEKYAASDRQKEYYVAADGSTQEMTKERELEMLDEAYDAHSRFMATSTQIWSELQDFKTQITYHSDSVKTEAHTAKNQDTSIKEQAYNAFMTAIHAKNNDISSPVRDVLNGIWDYFANVNHHNK